MTVYYEADVNPGDRTTMRVTSYDEVTGDGIILTLSVPNRYPYTHTQSVSFHSLIEVLHNLNSLEWTRVDTNRYHTTTPSTQPPT